MGKDINNGREIKFRAKSYLPFLPCVGLLNSSCRLELYSELH